MKDTIYLIPNAVKGGRPGAVLRNQDGHPLGYWRGSMNEIALLARKNWSGAIIIRCDSKGHPLSSAPPAAS